MCIYILLYYMYIAYLCIIRTLYVFIYYYICVFMILTKHKILWVPVAFQPSLVLCFFPPLSVAISPCPHSQFFPFPCHCICVFATLTVVPFFFLTYISGYSGLYTYVYEFTARVGPQIRKKFQLGVVAHFFNLSSQEAEPGHHELKINPVHIGSWLHNGTCLGSRGWGRTEEGKERENDNMAEFPVE